MRFANGKYLIIRTERLFGTWIPPLSFPSPSSPLSTLQPIPPLPCWHILPKSAPYLPSSYPNNNNQTPPPLFLGGGLQEADPEREAKKVLANFVFHWPPPHILKYRD